MPNPLFNILGGQQAAVNPVEQIVQEARKMRESFSGNPRETVQQLLASGQMSQQQFNQYAQIANQIVNSGFFK
jgi:flagellar hook-basal body complex protein FliE